jgi:hypothetical protein
MDPSISPPDIESALLRIRQYAREHDLTPDEVCDYFSTGIVAARVLRPPEDLTQSLPSIRPHGPKLKVEKPAKQKPAK